MLVTSALPYANGPLHLGHILENIQSDIWVRLQKLFGNSCVFICGDDAHGTPIMLSAKQQNRNPQDMVAEIKKQHELDFADFYINFDNYYTTHSTENHELVLLIFERLKQKGVIETREISQSFDPIANMFLPDRFVKGTCPHCKATNQYGDSCEMCGATYSPTDLINPISTISGSKPIQKSSSHLFFCLEHYAQLLKTWAKTALQPTIINKLNEWFTVGLKPWDISRDAPYFGFEIPGMPDKYFYVWLDAPIGYIASFKNFCATHQEFTFDAYWKVGSNTELYHFVGKDIIYFHALFWPAMLEGADLRKPTAIFTHGFVTINGQKMSKSRGTFINARDYLNNLDPEYLRYYFASKLTNSIDDIDFNANDFIQKINSDLVGKVINIASRTAKFINQNFANKLATNLTNLELFKYFLSHKDSIGKLYETRNYSEAIRTIMLLADRANQYIDEKKPWSIAKQSPNDPAIQDICTIGLNLFRLLILYLKPVLPKTAENVEAFLNISPITWNNCNEPLIKHEITEFKPLMQRVDAAKMMNLLNNNG